MGWTPPLRNGIDVPQWKREQPLTGVGASVYEDYDSRLRFGEPSLRLRIDQASRRYGGWSPIRTAGYETDLLYLACLATFFWGVPDRSLSTDGYRPESG